MTALAAIGGANAAFLSSVAIMSAAVKAAVPLYREYFGRVPWSMAGVFALAIVFDGGCALGFAAMTRETGATVRDAAEARQRDAGAAVARLQSEITAATDRHRAAISADVARATARLETLEAAAQRQKFALRTVPAIRVDIEGAEARATNCAVRGHTDACQYVIRLRSELADAEGRDAAAAALDKLRAQLAAPVPGIDELQTQLKQAQTVAAEALPGHRDWFAVAIASLAGVHEAWASRGFAALLTVFLELLAIFGLAAALRPLPATAEPSQSIGAATGTASTTTPPVSATAQAAAPIAPITPKKVAARQGASMQALREWVASATTSGDGWIYCRQRELADAIGCSGAAANAALRALVAAGAIELRAGRRGTAIRRLP